MKALFLLAFFALACCGQASERPTHRIQPCTLDPTFRFVPTEADAYEVDAAPDTILTGCSDGSGSLGQPYDEVLAPFPDGGADAEAVVSFKLPSGGCYQVVECASHPELPTVYPVADE